jgi:hypothetical protein
MSTVTLRMKDETATGKIINEILVSLKNELITVKDIIEARVHAEVDSYNSKLPEYYLGLVQPKDAEKTLNGFRLKQRKPIDAEQQVFVALNAFQKNGFFMLIDNKQAESLDEEVLVNDQTLISFIKLTPLVGG